MTAYSTSPTPSTPVARGPLPATSVGSGNHRAWRRSVAAIATLATALVLAGAAPAHAATSLNLITTGSSNTTVGYQIFANLNLMNGSATPTGTATFRLFPPTDPACTAAPIFTSTVSVAGTSVNSATFVTSDAGTYRWTTSYSGDANYLPGTTPCSSASADVVVAKSRSYLKVTAQAPVGGVIAATATLSGYSPTGTVTFYLTGPNNSFCSGTPLFTTTVAVDGAGTYVSATFDPTASGTYQWRASYGGDADNMGVSVTACMNSAGSVVV